MVIKRITSLFKKRGGGYHLGSLNQDNMIDSTSKNEVE